MISMTPRKDISLQRTLVTPLAVHHDDIVRGGDYFCRIGV